MSAWLELDAARIQVGTANRRISTSTFELHGSVGSIYTVESYYTNIRAGLEWKNIEKALT